MPLIVRYKADDGTTISGKANALDADAKLLRAIEVVAATLLGDERSAAMTVQERADFVAETMAQNLRTMARQYRNARIVREAEQAALAKDDL